MAVRPVILINPNTNAETTQMMVGVARTAQPGLPIEGLTVRAGPPLITNEEQLDGAAREVAALGGEVAGMNPAGVIVSAFGDPGADVLAGELAETVGCPVTGIAAACFAEAAAIGRFAVATTTPDLVARIEARVGELGHGALYCGTYLTAAEDVAALMADKDRLDAELEKAIARAKAAGAEVVCIGGGPLSDARLRIGGRTALPLLDPVSAAARWMARALASDGIAADG